MSVRKNKGRFRNIPLRLANWDYRWNAAYYVTICTRNRKYFFGKVVKGEMQLSDIGVIAQQYWNDIPKHFSFVNANISVVMPNHIHGIIIINNDIVDSFHETNLHPTNKHIKNKKMSSISAKSGSLSVIIRLYKSSVTLQARKINDGFGWQRRYYDRIIRNNNEFDRIKRYIADNPKNW